MGEEDGGGDDVGSDDYCAEGVSVTFASKRVLWNLLHGL